MIVMAFIFVSRVMSSSCRACKETCESAGSE